MRSQYHETITSLLREKELELTTAATAAAQTRQLEWERERLLLERQLSTMQIQLPGQSLSAENFNNRSQDGFRINSSSSVFNRANDANVAASQFQTPHSSSPSHVLLNTGITVYPEMLSPDVTLALVRQIAHRCPSKQDFLNLFDSLSIAPDVSPAAIAFPSYSAMTVN